MASASRRERIAVSDELRQRAHRFEFFQAVRLLERFESESPSGETVAVHRLVGEDVSPGEEAVRFCVLPSLVFPPGAIRTVQWPPAGSVGAKPQTPRMVTTFLGLTGPNGALPQHYTTLLIERTRAKDFALRDFLDLFHHRVISHFYRAWVKYRFPFAYERATLAKGPTRDDPFTHCIYCLVGLGTGGLRRRLSFDDEAFTFYAGHFAHHPRCAVSLETMLCDFFALPVEIAQFQGQWLPLSTDDQTSFPSPRYPQGRNTNLGESVVVGERVWNVESKIRIRVGPLGYADFCRFLPVGKALPALLQMSRTYIGPEFDTDAQLVLKGPEAPWCRLGGDESAASRLGWNTWVRCCECDHDLSDAVFSMEI
jgi:type VI secretion system protein ImpH